ncbi:DUF2946 domain-containing protein [Pseudomonas capsici]|uniref:DUF2946 domain-containing protein n=1 Tax=Pseudomonas capsici TaxID=2810614 RepID=UPI0021F0EC4B|nr:DUF2946 domain-containing protein [Pseudomonas capsici]MCV4289011.1 DUF2946 domain-containing protein [Pseudomonas capsici]
MNCHLTRRGFTAWALYFSVLFNLVSCGLVHGQMLGLALNGVGGQFCMVNTDTLPLSAKDLLSLSESGFATTLTCPMCAAIVLNLIFLLTLAWLLLTIDRQRFVPDQGTRAPPRYCWPSANPRASPC